MPKINLLDKSVYELIAAGEVIERPSSVIKELAENSIDAGAASITVEIKRGGISYLRVTDDGCGISHEDIPTAFMRHATSKVYTQDDLDSINTLGFRGEALASVCAVSRVELLTKQREDQLGSIYRIEAGEPVEYDRAGCADGTTIIIRDLFYNTPARLKFLKKDVTEGNYCASVIEKLALSHPGISFRFIRDGRQTMLSSGDGEYYSAVYAVFGKQFAAGLIPVENVYQNTAVTGYVSSPLFTRANRSMQNFFVNGRSVKSPLCCAALEEAFRNTIMVGKFPSCVLCVNTDPSQVDANIHPTKTEVRFTNEKIVFDAVYFAVKNALMGYDESREIKLNTTPARAENIPQPERARSSEPLRTASAQVIEEPPKTMPIPSGRDAVIYPQEKREPPKFTLRQETPQPAQFTQPLPAAEQTYMPELVPAKKPEPRETPLSDLPGFAFLSEKSFAKKPESVPQEPTPEIPQERPKEQIRVVGELFKTYIVCESTEGMILIDKHAAHERVNFERLKKGFDSSAQLLMQPEEVYLTPEEFNGMSEYADKLAQVGIIMEFTDGKARVTGLPQMLDKVPPAEIVECIAKIVSQGNTNAEGELFDDMLHTVACKASIRGNEDNDILELQVLAQEVFNNPDIRYCPHGRPVMTQISRKQIERYFGRVT
ncbi:MAG TPA: DNA mismatch repair endonuclease MutL [Ruminococcaceae bacterium]|nr:DNA mismatch repair endonuclease MutL [Oscillospiraceae bacterium]